MCSIAKFDCSCVDTTRFPHNSVHPDYQHTYLSSLDFHIDLTQTFISPTSFSLEPSLTNYIKIRSMHSGTGQMQKGHLDQFGLDERSVEELKEKAVAAKGRAYCRFCLSVCLCTSSGFVLCSGRWSKRDFFVWFKRMRGLLYWGYVTLLFWEGHRLLRSSFRGCKRKTARFLDFVLLLFYQSVNAIYSPALSRPSYCLKH